METGHKWTTWDLTWDNYIGLLVRVLGIPLYYVTHCNMPVGRTAANEHNRLKYQAIYIGPTQEANKMNVYTDPKACCLDGEGCSCIKSFGAQKYVQQYTSSLCYHYKGDGEVNEFVAWSKENIDNNHFTSEHTYSFDTFSTLLQDASTILNNNDKSHSENQMVGNIIWKIEVPNNQEMDECKRLSWDTHGKDFMQWPTCTVRSPRYFQIH